MTAPNDSSESAPSDSTPQDGGYQPYVPPQQTGPQALMVPLRLSDPLRWLRQGWSDFAAAPAIGIFYGVCFWLMAVVLTLVFRSKPEYVMSIASGCLLIGPFLAMGLYEVSRRRELGLKPELGASLTCWDGHIRSQICRWRLMGKREQLLIL